MLSHLERPATPIPSIRQILADFAPAHLANGFIGWIFAATAPVAIILAVGAKGGLSVAELNSWIFGAFFLNGLITIAFSILYRQPLAFFWSIPGAILVGPALAHLNFQQVVGAYLVTGFGMIVLGASDRVRRVMAALPMPIVMGMVAGVFMRFGLDLVRALHEDIAVAGPMVALWLALTARPALGRYLPPTIGALIVGAVACVALGRLDAGAIGAFEFTRPIFQTPQWSGAAMLELVVPLAVTVLAVQNAQGFTVLKAAGHDAPIDAITVACGFGTLASAMVGSVCTCLAGPTNAILCSSEDRDRRYTAGVAVGLMSLAFGLLAPPVTRFMLHAPKAFISTLAGLAMLRVLQNAFITSFKDRFTLGALTSFLVTVADIGIFNIGAAFWGLVAGFAVSLLLEKQDFRALARPEPQGPGVINVTPGK